MKNVFFLIVGLLVCLSIQANDSIPRVEDYLNGTRDDREIALPESFDNNMDSLLQDWHMKTFIPIDRNCKFDSLNPYVSDTVMMKRLADMPTVIKMPYNKIIRQFIDKYEETRRKQVAVMLGIGDYYFPMFEQALEKYRLPNELKYLSVVESALNPNATSRVGATGLWQFMFGTGKSYGLDINSLVDERRDPQKSTDAAVRYLKDLYGIFGDWHLAIAAYNCGPGNVNKAIRRSGGKKDYWDIYYYLPSETRGYVPLFIAANYVMTYYKEHRICPVRTEYPLHTDTLMLSNKIHFDQISAVVGVPKEDLIKLNPQYRREIIPGTTEKPQSVCLPANYTLTFIDYQDSIPNYRSGDLLNTLLTVEPAAVEKAPEVKAKFHIYKVRRGDSLSTIASKFHTTITAIKRRNGLHGSRINPGMRLKIY
ncbi:MAG TPA: transglycosylase SLT domain-containing protein [Bacteroidales bacterium]|nr:transglycosylase SLT domain-containing protein [Bacteroidales bacterium]